MEVISDQIPVESRPSQMLGSIVDALGTLGCKLGIAGPMKLDKIRSIDLIPIIRVELNSSRTELELKGMLGEKKITSRVRDAVLQTPSLFHRVVVDISNRRLDVPATLDPRDHTPTSAERADRTALRNELLAALDEVRSK